MYLSTLNFQAVTPTLKTNTQFLGSRQLRKKYNLYLFLTFSLCLLLKTLYLGSVFTSLAFLKNPQKGLMKEKSYTLAVYVFIEKYACKTELTKLM